MRKRLSVLLAVLLSFSLIAAACGDDSGGGSGDGGADVGLVFDTTGRGDQSFNDAAAAGLDRAVEELGITFTEATPNADGSNRAELLQLAAENSPLVIGVGFAFNETLGAVAADNPDVNFAVVDGFVPDLDNVLNLGFAEEQGSFLMGVAAALKSETGNVGFIGGVEGELIGKFQAGYEAGVAAVDPSIEVQVEYITPEGDFTGFNAPDRAKEIAAAMYDAGADVIYHAAGGSGLGLFEAAQDAGAWAIGVDSDQYLTASDFQDVILTSMLKRVDVAVFETIKAQQEGTFEGGFRTFDLSVEGVDYSTSGGYIDDIVPQLDEFKQQIVDGTIVVPTTPS